MEKMKKAVISFIVGSPVYYNFFPVCHLKEQASRAY
jgi:hypothetical protein